VARIGYGDLSITDPHRDHSQEDGPMRTDPAPDAGSHGPLQGLVLGRRLPGRLTGLRQSSASAAANLPGGRRIRPIDRIAARRHPAAPPARARAGVPPTPGVSPGAPAGATSGLMSIRQPVSRAASRAFWPSLPMASESW
jgi:hypothetical protein